MTQATMALVRQRKPQANAMQFPVAQRAQPATVMLAVYLGATALILLPAIHPGYLLIVDMLAVPHPRLVPFNNGLYLYGLLTYWLAHIVPADVLQKALLAAVFLAAGLGAHRLARPHTSWRLAAYGAGLLFLFNPAVYGRFFYGQWAVILGWALLPWLLLAIRRTIRSHQPVDGLWAGLIAGIMISWAPHSVFYASVVCACALIATLFSAEHRVLLLRLVGERRGRATIGIAVLVFLALVLPWLIPSLQQTSPVGHYLAAQTPTLVTRETQAFATVADPQWGTLGNVLAGYGFWAEATRRFVSAKAFYPEWPALIVVLPLLSAVGLVWRWRRGDRVVAPALAVSALIAIPLAIGVASPITRPVSAYLYSHVPFYAGLRDAQKWEGVVMLAYAYLTAGATDALLTWTQRHMRSFIGSVAAACMFVSIVPGVGLLFGGWGQVHPVWYPSSWVAADQTLTREMHYGAAVFLPWHLYLSFPFSRQVIANPAPVYFSRPIVSSNDAEIGLSQAGQTGAGQAVAALLLVPLPSLIPLATRMAGAGLCGVLLEKTIDWARYRFVLHTPGLRMAFRSAEISVLINTQPPCR